MPGYYSSIVPRDGNWVYLDGKYLQVPLLRELQCASAYNGVEWDSPSKGQHPEKPLVVGLDRGFYVLNLMKGPR